MASYTIRISSAEVVTLIVSVRNEQTRQLVASFKDEGLEESTEEIS